MRQPTSMTHQPTDPRGGRSRGRAALRTGVGVIVGLLLAATAVPSASAGTGGDGGAEAAVLREIAALESTAAPLAPIRCAKAAERAGWAGMNLVLATAIAMAESGCDPSATGSNPPTEGCPAGSRDRGAWQINDCYHPGVSDACAYDLQCNADAAYQIFLDRSGTFQPWTSYNQRTFRFFLTESRKAVRKLTGENIAIGVVLTEGGPLNVRERPRTDSAVVGQHADRAVVRIDCQTKGDAVYSPIFGTTTKIWNSDGPRRYFSDAYTYTDSNRRVAERC